MIETPTKTARELANEAAAGLTGKARKQAYSRAYSIASYALNSEKVLAKKREERTDPKTRAKLLAQSAKWRVMNRDNINVKKRERRATNPTARAKDIAYKKVYNSAHADERKAYRDAHKDRDHKKSAERRASRSEQERLRHAVYAEVNKERIAAYKAARYAAHREEFRAKNNAYAAQNREKKRAYNAGRREERRRHEEPRREEIRAYNATRYAANHELLNAQHREWSRSHPEEARAHNAKRRALLNGAPIGDIKSIIHWEKVWRHRDAVECHWCKSTFSPKECHSDHVVPLSKGGPHCLGNLVIACRKCNQKKHATMPEEWRKRLA